MTPSSQPQASGPSAALCSRLSAERGLPLIGSAGCYDAILAFELDAPWTPRLIGSRASDAALDAVIERIASGSRGVRLLALEPGEPVPGRARRTRVLHFFKRTEGFGFQESQAVGFNGSEPFGAFSLREYEVERDHLASTLECLAAFERCGAEVIPCPNGRRDILVCTHGARDACCGKFGYRLFLDFAGLARERHGESPVRVWRSSHLGGHRFAPTLLDLPSGRMYGRMADGDAAAVFGGGTALVERLSTIYRGRCALPEVAQIVERELWSKSGESFETALLRWQIDEAAAGWSVTLDATFAATPSCAMTARVVRADVDAVTTPASCGRDPETEAPWRILA